jgi:uncharacterized protein YlxW (UPF0749 family)
MSTSILIYIALSASILSLILAIYAVVASGKVRAWRKFFGTKSTPESLEDIIEQLVDKLKQLELNGQKTETTLEAALNQLSKATQHVAVVRYNSNGDDGGNLSFSAALLDAHQTGIVITSLHGRQQNRIYAKEVTNGTSESTLSEEERDVLISALTNKL